jgi:hypothetical protein
MPTHPIRTAVVALLLAAPAMVSLTFPPTGTHPGCAAPAELVVLTPTDASDDRVAVTAQALTAGMPGWATVGWHAADGVHVRTVTAVAADGTTEVLPPTTSGTATEVVALEICVGPPIAPAIALPVAPAAEVGP